MHLLEPGLALLFTAHQEQGVLLDCAGGGYGGLRPLRPPLAASMVKKHLFIFGIFHSSIFGIFYSKGQHGLFLSTMCV